MDKKVLLHDSAGNNLYPVIKLEQVYPAGALYFSTAATDPATLFGGTWQRIKDRFLLAAGDTYASGATGGEATHTLTVSEMPSHRHDRVLVDGNANFPLGSETGSQGPANRRKMTTTADTYGFFAQTNFSGGGCRSQQHAAVSCCLRLAKNGITPGKAVLLSGDKGSIIARQRRERSLSACIAGSHLSGRKYLYVCQFNEPWYVIWRNMAAYQGLLFAGGRRYIHSRSNRRRSVCKTGFRKLYVIRMERWPYNAFDRCKRGFQWRIPIRGANQIHRQHQHATQQYAAIPYGLYIQTDGLNASPEKGVA